MTFKGSTSLSKVYQAMLDAQMFYGEVMTFNHIVERLTALERKINRQG